MSFVLICSERNQSRNQSLSDMTLSARFDSFSRN
jgi:hypothetical protein